MTGVNQFDLVVGDMEASVAFFRRLGLEVHHDNPDHVQVAVPGLDLELDSASSVSAWNRGWKPGMASWASRLIRVTVSTSSTPSLCRRATPVSRSPTTLRGDVVTP